MCKPYFFNTPFIMSFNQWVCLHAHTLILP
uniref:Uncharacterized protein n=1 Tax=Anguilla anguilla TaxID=7936 RepID=A0A0E9XA28_ANGAN